MPMTPTMNAVMIRPHTPTRACRPLLAPSADRRITTPQDSSVPTTMSITYAVFSLIGSTLPPAQTHDDQCAHRRQTGQPADSDQAPANLCARGPEGRAG